MGDQDHPRRPDERRAARPAEAGPGGQAHDQGEGTQAYRHSQGSLKAHAIVLGFAAALIGPALRHPEQAIRPETGPMDMEKIAA